MDNVLAVNELISNTVANTVATTQINLQQIIDGYNGLDIGTIDNMNEILRMGKQPDQYLKNKIIDIKGEGANINGITLNRAKLLEMIEIPNNFKTFIVLLNNKLNVIDDDIDRCKKTTGFNVLKFNIEEGEVLPTPELIQIIDKAGKYYAQNQNQITVYQKVKDIIDILKELRLIQGTTGYGQKHIDLDQFVIVDPTNYELIPNHHIILDRIK